MGCGALYWSQQCSRKTREFGGFPDEGSHRVEAQQRMCHHGSSWEDAGKVGWGSVGRGSRLEDSANMG